MTVESHKDGPKVSLPKRSSKVGESSTKSAPVWSLAPPRENDPIAAPLSSICDRHNRPETVCCRELKDDDERELIDSAVARDLIIGLADGLTVPFALTAGLASLGNSKLVVMGGLAELFSGAISMGIGGYLSAESEQEAYNYLKRTTRHRVQRSCFGEMEREVKAILGPCGVDEPTSRKVASNLFKIENELSSSTSAEAASSSEDSLWRSIAQCIGRKPRSSLGTLENGYAHNSTQKLRWEEDVGLTAFLLKFGEGKEEIPTRRLFISAATIGSGYLIGGCIPLIPYLLLSSALIALYWSIGITTLALLVFGIVKTYYTGAKLGWKGYTKGALSTLFVGGIAAGSAWAIVRALDNPGV